MNGKELALKLLREPTERDKQTLIGASSFGSPCAHCVAVELAGKKSKEPNKWWLGAVNGTAIHGYLEGRAMEMLDDTALIEKKIELGTLEGYGTLRSTPDLVYRRTCFDWKTTTREKVKFYKEAWATEPDSYEVTKVTDARFTLAKYQGQIYSYGRGLWLAGIEVDVLTLVFICRDGLTDSDIWSIDFEWDAEYADRVWQRLENIWAYVRSGKDIDEIESHPRCYECRMSGRV